MICPECKKETKHKHLHNAAHGIPETHMAGSERIKCVECGYTMGKEEAGKQGIKFYFD